MPHRQGLQHRVNSPGVAVGISNDVKLKSQIQSEPILPILCSTASRNASCPMCDQNIMKPIPTNVYKIHP